MRILPSSLILALCVGFIATPDVSKAAIILETDQVGFTSALAAGSYLETFNTGIRVTQPSFTFTGGTPSYGYTISVPEPNRNVFASGLIVGNGNAGQPLAITPTTGNISALGGNFFITNRVDVFQAEPETLTVTDSLGATLTLTFQPSRFENSFLGFRSNGFITSVVLSAPPMGTDNATYRYNTLDNIIVGQLASAVPEPASAALTVAGLTIAGLLVRRRVQHRMAGRNC